MIQIDHWSRYFPTSREVRLVPSWAIVHSVISFKQVIQGKHPAFKVIAVSNYEVMLTISNTWLEVFQASLSHPHCQCFCLSGAHLASAGRASKVKIWRFLWNCVIDFFWCHLLLSRCFGAFQAGSLSWWSTSPPQLPSEPTLTYLHPLP